MQAATDRISARSKRQAMEWSLVLISQGITSSIECSELAGWELAVEPADYEKAREVLRLYRIENRWPWRRKSLERGLLFDWSSLAWAFLECFFYWLSRNGPDLTAVGLMDSEATRHGQWWRLFTAIWLHADLAHLAENAVIGIVLLGLAMARYGPGITLLTSYLAGALGNLWSWLLSFYPHHSLGASGMVMGALGLLAAHSFHLCHRIPQPRHYLLTRLAAGFMLFSLLGVAPGTDILAHAGGFISGLLLGGLLSLVPNLAHKREINLAGAVVFALLVEWPWWLSLRSETIL